MKSFRLLTDYLRTNKKLYLLAVVLIIVSNGILALLPKVLGEVTDGLKAGELGQNGIVRYSLVLLAIAVSYGLCFGLGQFTIMKLGRRFEFLTRGRIFAQFSRLAEDFFSKQGTGKLLSYVMNDVTSVREAISFGVTQTTNAVFMVISCIVMMLFSGIPLTLMLISVCPLVAIPFLVTYFGPRIRQRSMSVQENLASMTESADEQIGGIRVTKTFAIEPTAQDRFGTSVEQVKAAQLYLVRLSSLFQAVLPFLGALSLVVSLLLGGYMTLHEKMTLGSFVALTFYLRMLTGPLQTIGNVINMMQRSGASLDRVNRLLAEVPSVRDHENARPLRHVGSIEFDHLTFSYPGSEEYSLKDISFKIPQGHTVGLIGRTGSGKTTLAKLLLRIYEPPAGTIRVNHQDITDVTLESLRRKIGYVPQDGFLFSTDIADNIAFSDRSAGMDQVQIAASQALLLESVNSFPEGFQTRLGERGVTLSGGQRQRASLARGLMKKPELLILDDSMSAVDAVTESGILDNLVRERTGKTTLIIAHRISSVQHADEIIVLDQGRIAQRGTHEQLLHDPNGLYASLYRIQQEGLQHA
ncbi:ABC transporter ATP-binding protein [Paenibacillus physcomitrellae]|uniref:Multidrug ABC transporter permease/ATP-binding protein n=1 Tax=Paenibacillus physcomitrellae TaxID=1619311 RepID=A0ABQ1G2U8_9BACL|nr:ABC transporter ATP-binding protein [Paenibacillus physcomitrellae]GGA36283.1 multidrug ABC transporter permease/ATP-binding protein [Paenibacillus physcomitrellae]